MDNPWNILKLDAFSMVFPTSSPNISASSHPNQAARAEFEGRHGELGVLPSEKDKSKRSKKLARNWIWESDFRSNNWNDMTVDLRGPIKHTNKKKARVEGGSRCVLFVAGGLGCGFER